MDPDIYASLRAATDRFLEVLPPKERKELEASKTVPNADAIMTFTAELDAADKNRRGDSIATRCHGVLQSFQQFSSVIGTFIQSNPKIAALVWGSMKLTLQIASNYTSYFDRLSEYFAEFEGLLPLFADYATLFKSSERVRTAICNFHASVIQFCGRYVQVIRRSTVKQIFKSMILSFDTEFQDLMAKIRRESQHAQDEIHLAKAKDDKEEQLSQRTERDEASKHRGYSRKTLSRIDRNTKRWNKLFADTQVQLSDRAAAKRKLQLLQDLSRYNHRTAFHQACKRRLDGTAEWATRTNLFEKWHDMDDTESRVLWLSGKLGSGKTILAANIVQYLYSKLPSRGQEACVAYFFIRYDDEESLKAETILRSIIRQSLPPDSGAITLPDTVENALHRLEDSRDGELEMESLQELLRRQCHKFNPFYIVIDALDHCAKVDRDRVLGAISYAMNPMQSNTRLFLSSPESMDKEIERMFPSHRHLSMASPGAKLDMVNYIEEVIDRKVRNRDLIVGDESLVADIKTALINGADGMFTWIVLMIEDLCACSQESCDQEIRHVLTNLPHDLKDIFGRALRRIVSRCRTKTAQKVFRWVAAAKRPLSLQELREALAIEPCQPYSDPARYINDINTIKASCENLIQVNEDDDRKRTVHFAHHTVKQFVLETSSNPDLSDFHFQLSDTDEELGEICVTYLNFNDFKTQLIPQLKSRPPISPHGIAQTTLMNEKKRGVAKILVRAFPAKKASGKSSQFDSMQALRRHGFDCYGGSAPGIDSHPFREYASKFWLSHCTRLSPRKPKVWRLWEKLILEENSLCLYPWTMKQLTNRDKGVIEYICQQSHYALIRFIEKSRRPFLERDRAYVLENAARKGDMEMLTILVDEGHLSKSTLNSALRAAAEGGHIAAFERLLANGADVNDTVENEPTALQAAARSGHLETVERLLALGASVKNITIGRYTALEASSAEGHLEVVQALLEAGAEIDDRITYHDHSSGRTALQAAAESGHLCVIAQLLDAGANVNARPGGSKGYTALQAAAKNGHLLAVEMLLAAGAEPNATGSNSVYTALQAAAEGHLEIVEMLLAKGASINHPAGLDGFTALQIAARGGHAEIVNMLLAKGAALDVPASENGGRTALQAASENGHLEVVGILLAAGADVDDDAAPYKGLTALQAAAGRGHLQVVKLLLTAGAHVNAPAAAQFGRTALQAAAEGGHLEIVEILLNTGANVNAPALQYDGCTALQAAAKSGYLEVVEKLLAAGADANGRAVDWGYTALQAAAKGGYRNVVDRLIKAGADVNALFRYGNGAAIQAAAEGGYIEVCKALLAAKADIDITEPDRGSTALQAAAENGHLDMVEWLIAAGAKVNLVAGNGCTALQAAAQGGHLAVVEKLLAEGADANATMSNGKTALQAASQAGHLYVVDLLLAAGADINKVVWSGRTKLREAVEVERPEVVARLKTALGAANWTAVLE